MQDTGRGDCLQSTAMLLSTLHSNVSAHPLGLYPAYTCSLVIQQHPLGALQAHTA
jgi:hypothetical protein